jgi:hypothetical protein
VSVDKDIRYSITAEDRFARTFANLRRDVASAGSVMAGVVEKANLVGSALGFIGLSAVSVGGLSLTFRNLVNDLDALNDAADVTGSSIENLSALEDVARRNGEGLQTVVDAALKLNKVLNEAKPGSAMEQTLQRIGLSAAELRKDDPSIALQKLAQALAGFAADGDQARLVLDLTGKSAKVLAPVLKDLAAAGDLNAKVTTEQSAEAEKFNKQLFALQAEASNAARALTSDLLPAANDYLATVRKLAQVPPFTLFKRELVSEVQSLRLRALVFDIEALTDQLTRQPGNATLQKLLADARVEYEQLSRAAASANEQLKATLGVQAAAKDAGGGRGFINPPQALPRIGAPLPAAGPAASAPRISEAQRYLDNLARQGEKLQELTTYQQLLADIENRRIDGITPKLERELKQAATRVDLQRQLNAEIEKEAGFQRLLSDKDQANIDEVQRLLQQTNSGRLQGLEGQADKLLEFSRRIAQNDPRQAQVLEAMKRLREEAEQIERPAAEAATAYDRLADSIEKSMDRATDSILDMVVEGKGGVSDLGKAFARDVLRALIGDPVRDTMKEVAASIRQVFKGQGGLEGLLASLISTVGGMFGGGGNTETNVGNDGFGGYGSRALGGPVNAGQLYRWQENGREWFVPEQNGTVMTQGQMRAMAGGGQVIQHNTFHINGGNPAETQRMIEAALSANNQQLLRSRNTGGAFAGA